MADFEKNRFNFAGRNYVLFVQIVAGSQNDTFVNEYIESLELVNSFDTFFPHGNLVYTDTLGMIDNYNGIFLKYLDVQLFEVDEKGDGGDSFPKLKGDGAYIHKFMIDNIEILDRDRGTIRYNIHFTSTLWSQWQYQIRYSNYGKKKETAVEIIKTIMSGADLLIGDSFDKIGSGVTMNYITQDSDTVESSVVYLMNKFFFYDGYDEAFKFLFFDEFNGTYEWFDISNMDTSKKKTDVNLTVSNSLSETSIEKYPVMMGSRNSRTTRDIYSSLFSRKTHTFSLEGNTFGSYEHKTSQIKNFFNKRAQGGGVKDRIVDLPIDKEEFNTSISQCEWDHVSNTYNDMVYNIINTDSLIIHTSGILGRKLGHMVSIGIDFGQSQNKTEDKKTLKNDMRRYTQLQGLWYISSNRLIIVPSSMEEKASFKQNLCLIRNFVN